MRTAGPVCLRPRVCLYVIAFALWIGFVEGPQTASALDPGDDPDEDDLEADVEPRRPLETALARAMAVAEAKLATAPCATLLFLESGPPGVPHGTSLQSYMQQARGFGDAATYLSQGICFETESPGQVHCDPAHPAYTAPYSSTVHLCTSFLWWPRSRQADFLIHEELHTLGLYEAPAMPGSMSAAEIQRIVEADCGS